MPGKIAFLHTVPSLVPVFNELAKELLPSDYTVFHIVDEMLLNMARAEGRLSPFQYRRVADHVVAAEYAGADVVQVTCSSISPCVDAARYMTRIPVLKIDEAMVDRALAAGTRIGVAATLTTTLEPTKSLVKNRAQNMDKTVDIDAVVCDGAFAALSRGDMATHDKIVKEGLQNLLARNDVVILAQASMARVADQIPRDGQQAIILSSPRLAMERLRTLLPNEN